MTLKPSTVAALALALVIATPAGTAAAPEEATVTLTGDPVGLIEVAEGGRVTFHAATGDHDIAADDGSWTTGEIPEGQEAVLQFNTAGDYAFHCSIHANETGTVRVTAPADEEAPANGPPQAAFTSPADGATVSGVVDVRLRVTDPDDAPSDVDVRLRVDDGPWVEPTYVGDDVWEWAWDTREVTRGPHTIEALATDAAGGTAPASTRVHVDGDGNEDDPESDNEAPTIRIESPERGTAVRAPVTIRGSAADADGDTLRVEIATDDEAWRDAEGGTEWTFEWDPAGYAPGVHEIRARAWDGSTYSPVAVLELVVPEPVNGFDGPDAGPDAPTGVEATGWKNVVLDAGWAVLGFIALATAWAWASSRP